MSFRKSIVHVAFTLSLMILLGSASLARAQEEEVFPVEAQTVEPAAEEVEVVEPEEPAPEKVEVNPSIGELRLGFMPFFSADGIFNEKSEETIGEWLESVVDEELDREGHRGIEAEWLRSKKIDDKVFKDLPGSRVRGAAELLEPVAKRGKVDGVMATWLQARDEAFELVFLLYLPNRIQLEEFTLSANFERASLEKSEKGGIVPDRAKALMRELLGRNLRRIKPAAPAHSPSPEPAPAEEEKDEEKPGDAGEGESSGASKIAVLDFSREFSMSLEELQSKYSELPTVFPFRSSATNVLRRALGESRVAEALDSTAVTFNQIEAPVLDLDPDADRFAREKALLAQAGPDIDALVMGHVREKKKALSWESISASFFVRTTSISKSIGLGRGSRDLAS